MENLVHFSVNLLVWFSWSGIYIPSSSFAFPSKHHGPWTKGGQTSKDIPHEQQSPEIEKQYRVNTVTVICHPDFMEIAVKADMFEVGTPINGDELRLGVDHRESCRAAASSVDEYRIVVGLSDCGTKHWITDDSLIYTNLLIYSPVASPDGLIRMDEAVIPIECHYGRKYSLTSSSLTPTWIPFTSTEAAVESLDFDLRIMTSDWMYERGSRVFYLGEPINIEASVRVGHHMGFRIFVSSCVATLDPDADSIPRYVFIDNDGCLLDSQLQGSHSQFLPRIQDDKLQLTIDAFRFLKEDRRELYITCHLAAVPVTNHADPQNKACTFFNGRWRSADGSDYLCSFCQGQSGSDHASSPTDSQLHSIPGYGPRGYGKPGVSNNFWRSGMTSDNVLEQEAGLGPMLILQPRHKSGPLPPEDLPPLLSKIGGPLYGSHWRSGIQIKTGHYPFEMFPEESYEDENFGEEELSEIDLAKGLVPGPPLIPTPEPGTLGMTTEAVVQTSGQVEQDKGDHLDMDPEKPGTKSKDRGSEGAVEDEDVASPTNGTTAIAHEPSPSPDKATHEAEVHTTAAPSEVGPTTPVHKDNHEAERTTLTTVSETDPSDKDDPIKK